MVSVMLYPCVLCVALLMDLFVLCVACCVFDSVWNCLVKQFAICLGVVVILLLNVMEVFSVVGGALFDRPCMVFQRVYISYSIGRRMNWREYENMPEMNSVMDKEGRVVSTTLDIEIKFVIKRISHR